MENKKFKLISKFSPFGSQPDAIKKLTEGIEKGHNFQTLLGVTGSGKTFTVANVIKNVQKPTLVLAHNKTLAAQLYEELKSLFPENRVEYFVSYYDYYQPESYIPATGKYIEKDAAINPKIEQLRLSATTSLISRKDVIVVSSISCIYGLGNPENFKRFYFGVSVGEKIDRKKIILNLLKSQYERNDTELVPGKFRVKGDVIDIVPSYSDNIIRIELFGKKIDRITEIEKTSLNKIKEHDYVAIYPAKHFVVPEEEIERATEEIKKEMEEEIKKLDALEAHRLKQRTLYDLEMIKETGYCKGIENYSRFFDGRKIGEKPYTLLDYFPEDSLMVIDESHQTIPQIHGMYKGDFSRKKNLVDFGFRLSSAYDNRPLKFEEVERIIKKRKVIFVSATPGEYEKKISKNIVEQIIRPTGLVDPPVFIHPIKNQIESLKEEIIETSKKGNRSLITALTKKLAEELSDYLSEHGIKTRYLHSEIKTLERSELIREFRLGKFECLVGINLLREGLDIPEVGFVGILDADKEGFLRNDKSLIQTIGRAARNVDSRVILYADEMTDSIKSALEETNRRRKIQMEFNEKNKITPKTISKAIPEQEVEMSDTKNIPKKEIPKIIIELNKEMEIASDKLNFERAIILRERIKKLQERL